MRSALATTGTSVALWLAAAAAAGVTRAAPPETAPTSRPATPASAPASVPAAAPESAPATAPAPAAASPVVPVATPAAVAAAAAADIAGDSRSLTPGLVTAFVGVGVGAIGGALAGAAGKKNRTLRADLRDGEIEWLRYEELRRQGSDLAVAAYMVLGAAVALGAAGLYLLVRKPDPERGALLLTITPVEGGVMAAGAGSF